MIRAGCLLGVILFAAWPIGAAARDLRTLDPVGEPYEVGKGLKGKKKDGDDKKAKDISGIACLPPASGPRRCLIVNDENPGAQFITIDGRSVTAGDVVSLIGEAASDSTLGSPPPRHDCSNGEGAFSDLDGEGVAYAAPYFYVVGSHGCARKGNAYRPSAFLLTRVRMGTDGAGAVEATYRLGDALQVADIVGPHFARDLQRDESSNGLNIEGVAILDGRLFAGLRAPSIDGNAYIVAVGVEDLFAAGHDRLTAKPIVIPVPVGQNTGIRDLTVLPDRRLLVLTGPAQERDVDYALFAVEAKPGGKVEALGRLAKLDGEDKGGKAEAVVLLDGGHVLVWFDGLKNGAPREYDIAP